MVNTIQHNYRFDANYFGSITDDIDLFANAGFAHWGNRLQANGLRADPYDLVSATIGLRKGPYEVALIGDNLLDERGPTFRGNQGPTSGSGMPKRLLVSGSPGRHGAKRNSPSSCSTGRQ